ncbi:MAG TPA: hypothetical protein VGG70_08515 [Candidatus Cybelea sp.]
MKRVAITVTLLAALAACSNNAKSNAGGSPQPAGAATPDCHGESAVWALARTKVYMLPDDPHYGRTMHGSYMCLSDAQGQGFRHARGYGHRHHRRQDALTP